MRSSAENVASKQNETNHFIALATINIAFKPDELNKASINYI